MLNKTENFSLKSAENNHFYQDLVETSQNLIWQCDAEGRYTYLNPACELTFGYKTDEMLGRKFSDFQSPESGRDLEKFRQQLQHGTVKGYEAVYIGKDGNKINLIINAKNILDDNGKITGTRGTASDITGRKQIEESLKKSEEMFSRAFQFSPLIFCISRMSDNCIIEINDTFEKITGYSRSDIAGCTAKDLGLFENPGDYEKICKKLKTAGNIKNFEARFRKKNGENWIGLMSAETVKLDDEPCVIINFIDITDRKIIEEALFAEKELLSVTLLSIGDGVITTDINSRIININKVAEKLTGWARDEAVGMHLNDVLKCINGITRKPVDNPVEKVLSTGNIIEMDNQTILVSSDGTESLIADSGAPIRDLNGNTIGVVLVFRDITEKQKLIENFQKNQKLEALGILAGGIAHDFNNLLAGIFGSIDLAMQESRDETVSAYLSNAMSTIKRAKRLTQKLLTFAKGGSPVKKIDSLNPFIQESVQFALSGSNISCSFEIPDNLWHCNYDNNQLGQVIHNIIINAQQAMPEGGDIKVSAENLILTEKDRETRQLRKGNYVKIKIKDSGIGIPNDMVTRIFDPFFTTKEMGHGLGLATCHSIVNRHDGLIDVKSKSGKGSTFYIYLPAFPEKVFSDAENTGSLISGSGKILVMDDEEIIRKTVGAMLKLLGYSSISAKNGKEALDTFNEDLNDKKDIAGIILDLTIPGGMGGIETVSNIRKKSGEIPVIVASGYSDDPAIASPEDYGFNASICKPFTIAELAEVLNKFVMKKI